MKASELLQRIPVAAQTYEWDPAKKHFPMKLLPDFANRVKEVAKPEDTIMAMCRSGGRSAIAIEVEESDRSGT